MWTQRISAVALAAICLAAAPVGAQEAAQGAEVEVTRVGLYPTTPHLVAVAPARFDCTQLELSAGIRGAECGTMQLHEVIQKMIPSSAD